MPVFLALKARRVIPFWGRIAAAASSAAVHCRDEKPYPGGRAQQHVQSSPKLLGGPTEL